MNIEEEKPGFWLPIKSEAHLIYKEELINKTLILTLLVMAFLSLAACSSGSGQALTANLWILTELNGQAPLPDKAITAEFSEDGKVSGSASCNNYTTTYTLSGKKITFGEQVASTMMACPDPVMEQERAYMEALNAAATFEIVDDELTLFDVDGNPAARFEAINQSLEGTSWQVIGYNNGKGVVSVIIGTEITADFGEDGQLTGNASCNNYFASYETEEEDITIGPAGSTRMACQEPEGIMEQEQQYLAALETAATYKIMGFALEMRTSEGSLVATFQRVLMP